MLVHIQRVRQRLETKLLSLVSIRKMQQCPAQYTHVIMRIQANIIFSMCYRCYLVQFITVPTSAVTFLQNKNEIDERYLGWRDT